MAAPGAGTTRCKPFKASGQLANLKKDLCRLFVNHFLKRPVTRKPLLITGISRPFQQSETHLLTDDIDATTVFSPFILQEAVEIL